MPNQRKLRIERLEDKRLLAILWGNEFGTGINNPNFDTVYQSNETVARTIVNRAIDDWERVITSFNYDDPNNDLNDTFTVNISAIAGGFGVATGSPEPASGKPLSGTILMGSDANGLGWFFDETPYDDVEFTGLVSENAASFIDGTPEGQAGSVDFYRIITHELGHALGFAKGYSRFNDLLTDILDPADSTKVLKAFGDPNAPTAPTATVDGSGSHLYRGGPVDPSDLLSHPDQVMNDGGDIPLGSPAETMRQFISDLEVQMLADAFGYTVTLPSTFDSAHVMFDEITGTLLVQGSARDEVTGAGFDDTITIDLVGNDVVVVVTTPNGIFTERVPNDQVKEIVIHRNGEATPNGDTVTVNVAQPVTEVDYVVSTNQDVLEGATSVGGGMNNDGIIDISDAVPGSQTPLRAAIVEANARPGAQTIYVGRGVYDLTLSGTGGDTEGDFDISDDLVILGAGAGATVIRVDPSLSNEGHFEVATGGKLELRRLTLTGGTRDMGGSIAVADNINGVALTLNEVAVVDNSNSSIGGAIYVGEGSQAEITRSVVTNNSANFVGGGIAAAGFSTVTLKESIIAKNSANIGDPDLASGGFGNDRGKFVSAGKNLIGVVVNADYTDPTSTDYISTGVDYVVTSLVDTFEPIDNDSLLSIREAVDLANSDNGGESEVWLPAWNFVLTRQRDYSTQLSDTDVSYGDIDIAESIILRGIDGITSIDWTARIEIPNNNRDKIFDLLGSTADGTSDATAGGADFLIWQREYLSGVGNPEYEEFLSDFDDDGDVDGDDQGAVWQQYFGNTLDLEGIDVLS